MYRLKKEIFLEDGDVKKNFFYVEKKSSRIKSIKIKIIDQKNLEIILPEKNFLEKIFFEKFLKDFSAKFFLEKNKKWILKNSQNFSKKIEKKDWKKDKIFFEKKAKERVEFFNNFYKFSYKNIYIKDQKSRWGSCSSERNLNFNYRIFLLPEKYCDYVVVHELCHLKEMNHGKDFWKLVEKKIPDYKKIRKDLKKFLF